MNAHLATYYMRDETPSGGFTELQMVRTRVALLDGEVRIPTGTVGTVVHAYESGNEYEVEFADPPSVLTVRGSELEPA